MTIVQNGIHEIIGDDSRQKQRHQRADCDVALVSRRKESGRDVGRQANVKPRPVPETSPNLARLHAKQPTDLAV